MANKLSDIMPHGDSKEDLIYKMRSLLICEYKGHHDAFVVTMCDMMDVATLKKIFLHLDENKSDQLKVCEE